MKLKISISPATFILLLCMIATTPVRQLSAYLCAATLHELGHVIAAKMLRIDLAQIKLDVIGARLTTTGRLCSYHSLILLCFAGPLVNFLCFAPALLEISTNAWLAEFCLSNLSLGVLNLIPIEGFDGGRILHAVLCKIFPLQTAERICGALSFCALLSLWMLSVWLLLRTGSSLTLFVFSCCLFGMLFL